MIGEKNRKYAFRRLDEDRIVRIHEAGLEIMDRVGMCFDCPEALALFESAGARISDGNLVQIPPRLVEKALASAPGSITIHDRNLEEAMLLDGKHIYYGTGADCMHIHDLDTGQRRPATMEDLTAGLRVADAMPNLDFVKSMFLPSDVPANTYERHQMAAMLRETTKPIVISGLELGNTRRAVAMAAAVAGGMGNLSQRPFVVNYVNPISAFMHNRETLERLLYAAGENLPTIYAPGNSRGTTAPMSVAGMLALGNAGQLAGLVLSQLKREGSPFIMNYPGVGALDMRTMVDLYVTPDRGSHGWEMAAHYGLPVFCSGGAADAKVFDQQAAAEAVLTLMADTVGGADMVENIGYLDSAMTGSLEAVCLGDEIIGWMKRYFRPIEVSEETLSLDLIREIGPDGQFLATSQTLEQVREDWRPRFFDRRNHEKWNAAGGLDFRQRANKTVKELIGSHRAEPLPGRVLETLDRLVEQP